MAKITKTVEMSKEMNELLVGVADVVGAVKQAMADGWQPGQDLPVIVMSAIAILPPAIQGVDQIKGEFAEDKAAFVAACSDGVGAIISKF